MSNYLVDKFLGKYRIIPDIDLETNDFPKDCDGNIDEDMVHISCQNGNKVWYWGANEDNEEILGAYIPSKGRGRNIKKALVKDKIKIFDYDETEDEVTFKFFADDINSVIVLLKPYGTKTKVHPFDTKNLPKSDVEIPKTDMDKFKNITSNIDQSNMWYFKKVNENFLTNVLEKSMRKKTKKRTFSCVDDMRRLKMSRQFKEYVWYCGMWEEYLKFVDEEFKKYYNNK